MRCDLLANLTTTAVWLLGVLLGIQLICEGVALSSLGASERVSGTLLARRRLQYLPWFEILHLAAFALTVSQRFRMERQLRSVGNARATLTARAGSALASQ
jgi:hypothetical protein